MHTFLWILGIYLVGFVTLYIIFRCDDERCRALQWLEGNQTYRTWGDVVSCVKVALLSWFFVPVGLIAFLYERTEKLKLTGKAPKWL